MHAGEQSVGHDAVSDFSGAVTITFADGSDRRRTTTVAKKANRGTLNTSSTTSSSSSPSFLKVWWVRFLPALMLYPIWAATMTNNEIWTESFTEYWPATLGMVLGSFLAGSTPLGGGVVAFPIAVLVLNFESEESRDASVLVQAVGMNAAGFLLATTKPHLLDARLIVISSIGGTVGVVAGMIAIPAAANTVNLVYTLAVFEFALIFWFINTFSKSDNSCSGSSSQPHYCLKSSGYKGQQQLNKNDTGSTGNRNGNAEVEYNFRTCNSGASISSGISIMTINPTYIHGGESESDLDSPESESEAPACTTRQNAIMTTAATAITTSTGTTAADNAIATNTTTSSTSTTTTTPSNSTDSSVSVCIVDGDSSKHDRRPNPADKTEVACVVIFVAALVGGFVTSKVGSGSDIAMFVAGIFGWNTLCPSQRLGDAKLTASSVVVMGILSAVASLLRAMTAGFSPRVLHCWGAMACVVVLGAPLGSFVLSPKAVPYLRLLFYVLAVVQLVLFGVLKIKDDAAQWSAVGGVTACVVVLLIASKSTWSR